MKAVLQRATSAWVTVDGKTVGRIGPGLVVFLGVAKGDDESDSRLLAEKIRALRIFSDEQGKMNRSLLDSGNAVLLVSQFTLLGRTSSGRRPSFDLAAPPDEARRLYERLATQLRAEGTTVETGDFGAYMQVHMVNDGPVTFVLESRQGSDT